MLRQTMIGFTHMFEIFANQPASTPQRSKFKDGERRYEVGQRITIPKDTELNHGTHEDSDHLTLTKDVRAQVLELENNGAIKVQLLNRWNQPIGDPIYFHQPAVWLQ
jgi:hypothetical protein